MNVGKLLVISTTLFSIQASAVVCEAQLQTQRGRSIKDFIGQGPTQSNACARAIRDCKIAQKELLSEGRNRKSECVVMSSTPGNGGVVTRPTRPSRPTVPTIPTRPIPPVNNGGYYGELGHLERTIATGGTQARRYAVEELKEYTSLKALVIAVKALSDSDYYVRVAAQKSVSVLKSDLDLSRMSVSVIHEMSALITSGSQSVRLEAVKIVGMVETAQGILTVIDSLSDSDYYVRVAAQKSLDKLIQSYDFDSEIRINLSTYSSLALTANTNIRKKSVQMIGKANILRALPTVIKANNDSDYYVRVEASKVLNNMMNDQEIHHLPHQVLNTIKNMYYGSAKNIRMAVVKVLGATKEYSARNVLFEALDDSDYYVRVAARNALNNM